MKSDNLGFIVFTASIVLILVVAIRHNLFRDIRDMDKTVQIGLRNIDYQFFPNRPRPITYSAKEVALKQFHPSFFNNLSRDGWAEFWDIIYGAHPLIGFKNEKLVSAERNFYISEIQGVLVQRYPEAFSGFAEGDWRAFWKTVYGIPYSEMVGTDATDRWNRFREDRSERRLDKKIKKDNAVITDEIKDVRKQIGE